MEATDILKCGMVKKEYAVPQGQNSTNDPGFTVCEVSEISRKKSGKA